MNVDFQLNDFKKYISYFCVWINYEQFAHFISNCSAYKKQNRLRNENCLAHSISFEIIQIE